jgi:hypothetical protein
MVLAANAEAAYFKYASTTYPFIIDENMSTARSYNKCNVRAHATHQKGDEDKNDAHPYQDRAHRRNIPWNGCIVARPAQPEGSYDEHWPRDHRRWQAFLWRRETSPLFDQLWVRPQEVPIDGDGEQSADSDPDKHEASLGNRKTALLTEDKWIRLKHCALCEYFLSPYDCSV